MFELIAQVLSGFYGLPVVGGSYGIAIILLTVAVMVLLMPLTLKATRSTIKMQQVQPELKRIQKKHKGDREALNAEMMQLYQEHGINPVGGCLPMLAQMPVFLVLFRILRELTRRADQVPFYDVGVLAGENAGMTVRAGNTFDPRYLSTDSEMYKDLVQTTKMDFGPFDLAAETLDVVKDNFVTSIPYVLLILFVVATSFYQQRQVSARRDDSDTTPQAAQQQAILKVLPLMTGIWSFIFPTGLVVYWATSNLFRIGQQAYITHQIYGREGATEKIAAAKVKTEAVDVTSSEKKSTKTESSKGKAKSSNKKTGTGKKSKSAASEKEAAWQKRKADKAKANPKSSNRITPKGTAPKANKKNRKR